MYTGNPEHAFDTLAFEQVDEGFAASAWAGMKGCCRGRAGFGDAGDEGGMAHGS